MLKQYVPDMMDHPMIEFTYQLTISEILATAPGESETLFKMVIDHLNKTEITV
ncbi:MAG: hypothetical protein ACQEWW_17280 [Bacillota bacterium]